MSGLVPPEFRELVLSVGAAAAGRVLLLLRHPPAVVSVGGYVRTVLWELPIVCAVGFLGYWLGAALDAGQAPTVILIAVLAHWGPTKIDQYLDALLARLQIPPK